MVFKQYKPQRTISWRTEHGSSVELELELQSEEVASDGTTTSSTVQLEVPLADAQAILLFLEKGIEGEFSGKCIETIKRL